MSRSLVTGVGVVAGLVIIVGGSVSARGGTATSGVLYFDSFRIGHPFQLFADASVRKVHFSYDGTAGFTLGMPAVIKDLGPNGNADGLIFAPNGNLLIGGSTTGAIEQITRTGTVVGSVTVGGT